MRAAHDVQRDLSRYVPAVATDWDPAADPRWREVDATLVFVDISGFTNLSERLARFGRIGAEELTDVLNRVFGAMLDLAYERSGSLLKFGGDALLLLFQGPDHVAQACCAAVEMRTALREAAQWKTSVGRLNLKMSVGVHSGLVHVFRVGRSHTELLITGPTASGTTAMEHAADAGEILVSAEVRNALGEEAAPEAKGPGWLLEWRRPPTVPPGAVPRADHAPDVFAGFVPRALRSHLEHGAADPEHRIATVAFVKFMGVDGLMASGGPAVVADALAELVETVQEAVDAEDVTFLASDIDEDGGKVILTAGVPVARDDDDGRMLRAARRIIDAHTALSLKIGVNRGHVFAGEIGTDLRRTYTVMGDTVNLAARLMAHADPGRVLASPDVVEGSHTPFETAALEPFFVKGKTQPVQALAVGAVGDDVDVVESVLPLFGREREMAAMSAAWVAARGGTGRVIELCGEPGIGKSRLLEELLRSVGDVRQERVECRLYQSATPYFPVGQLLRRALDVEHGDDDETIRRLRGVVAERAPALEPWMSLLGLVLGVAIEESGEVRALEEQFRRTRLEEAVVMLLATLLPEPTVLVVEDTHWMDEASKDLLTRWLPAVASLPWLICLTSRPVPEAFRSPAGAWLHRMELEPLSHEAAAALITAATESDPLQPQQVDALARRAEGNPLFLVELLGTLDGGSDLEGLPQSVEGLIEIRIDRLPPADRTLLRKLAVLGAGFRFDYASVVVPGRRAERAGAVARLGDFLTLDRKGWVQFRHGLIRDVAYEGLPYKVRKELHAEVADAIVAGAGDDVDDQAALLSLHYFHSGRWEKAWRFSRLAGDAAKAVYANVDAATFYERALASAKRLGADVDVSEVAAVWATLGTVREQAGVYDGSLAALRSAMQLLRDDPVARADLHFERARVYARTGAYPAALRETALGTRLVGPIDSPAAMRTRPRLLAFRGFLRVRQGKAKEALYLGELALEAAGPGGDGHAMASAYSVLDAAHVMLGQPGKAGQETKALEIYEAMGDLAGVANAANNLGVYAYSEGRWDDALAWYSKAQESWQRSGNDAQAAIAGANIVELLTSQGRLEEAEKIVRYVIRVARAHAHLDALVFAEIQAARLALARNELAAAEAALEASRAEAEELGSTAVAMEACIHLADVKLQRGDPVGALEVVAHAERVAGGDVVLFEAPLGRLRGSALVGLGLLDEAAVALEQGLAAARDQGLAYEEARLLLVEADLAAARGMNATEARQQAERLLQSLGVRSPAKEPAAT